MTKLTYLGKSQITELERQGRLDGPIHKEHIERGFGTRGAGFFSLLTLLGLNKFKPNRRFIQKVEELADKHNCNAVFIEYSRFEVLN